MEPGVGGWGNVGGLGCSDRQLLGGLVYVSKRGPGRSRRGRRARREDRLVVRVGASRRDRMLRRRQLPGWGGVDWSRKRGSRGNGLVACVVRGILLVVHRGERRRRQRSRSGRLGRGEPGASHDHLAELGDGNPLDRVELKDAPHDGVQLMGDGQNGAEELRVLHVSTEGAVLERSTLPWVAATGQVDQDDTKTPDVVGCRGVARVGLGCGSLAFWKDVST